MAIEGFEKGRNLVISMVVKRAQNTNTLLARFAVEANGFLLVQLALDVLLDLDVEETVLLSDPGSSMKLNTTTAKQLNAIQAFRDRPIFLVFNLIGFVAHRWLADFAYWIFWTRLATVDDVSKIRDEEVVG